MHWCNTGPVATNLLEGVLEAQTRNSLLAGDELLHAARALIEVLGKQRFTAMSSDSTGGRILGAALLLEPSLGLGDQSHRFDGCTVMLVAGHVSGDARVSLRAKSVRALGATEVHVALLSRWTSVIGGCDQVWHIGSERPLRALSSA